MDNQDEEDEAASDDSNVSDLEAEDVNNLENADEDFNLEDYLKFKA